jgi:hypothetical protein
MAQTAISLARDLSRTLRAADFVVKHSPTDTRIVVGDEAAQATVVIETTKDDPFAVKLYRGGLHGTGRKPLGFPTRVHASIALREELALFLEKSGLFVDVIRWPNE